MYSRTSIAIGACLYCQLLLGQAPVPESRQERPEWREAVKEFEVFAEQRIKDAKTKFPKQRLVRMVEYRSRAILEALPDYRLFVLDSAFDHSSRLFALHTSGKIADLGNSVHLRAIADFVRGVKIKVGNGDDAIRTAQLIEEVQGAPHYVAFVRINTENFTIFDRRFIEAYLGPNKNWNWSAEKQERGWSVTRSYVGPPAMIEGPPVYEIVLGENKELVDFRRRDERPD